MFELETETLNRWASFLPSSVARRGRWLVTSLRYRQQQRVCRSNYLQFGDRYSEPLIFIAGLPKSGTTWMKNMLASYPGYHEVMIPEAVRYEIKHGGSHDFELPDDLFQRMDKMLAVLKLHVPGSQHNAALLRDAGIPYLVMYRDLRDVAVSHYFYVRRTPWHPEYEMYSALDIENGLLHFARTLLPDFAEWVRSWDTNGASERNLVVRYEDMLSNTEDIFTRVARHFDLDDAPERITDIVDAHRFRHASGGRRPGQTREGSFLRKGIAGDWKNHFTPRVRSLFKECIGDFLLDFGYEEDKSW